MKLPNGYGSVVKMSGKRRKPYMVRRTVGWKYDPVKDRQVQQYCDRQLRQELSDTKKDQNALQSDV